MQSSVVVSISPVLVLVLKLGSLTVLTVIDLDKFSPFLTANTFI